MNPAIISALATLLGCIISGYVSMRVATKQHDVTTAVIVERVNQLEKKVDIHNNLIDRTYKLEKTTEINKVKIEEIQEKIKE